MSWGKLSEIPPVLPSGAANNGNGTQVTKPVNWAARTLDPRSSPLPGTGKTWTVGPGGNYATITAALDARTTMDGDTIRVLAGTYGPGNPFDLTPGAAGGAGFNVNKAVLIDGGLNHMDFSTFNNNTGSCAGYSGGHPFSGFGAIVPGTVRSIPFGTPTQWAINTAYPATTTVSNNALPVAVINGGNVYVIVTPGTSASSGRGPTGAGSSISDGTAVWQYVQTYKECIIKNFIISHVGLDLGGFGSLGAVRANSAGRANRQLLLLWVPGRRRLLQLSRGSAHSSELRAAEQWPRVSGTERQRVRIWRQLPQHLHHQHWPVQPDPRCLHAADRGTCEMKCNASRNQHDTGCHRHLESARHVWTWRMAATSPSLEQAVRCG